MKENIIKNPIFEIVKESIQNTENQLFLAVPFITSYATRVLNSENILSIIDKKCITRFDESTLLSFDVPTLLYLLDLGFEMRYDNNIHLKLYITDNDTYVSSSNLTQSGFEDKIELTVRVDNSNTKECLEIFSEIWQNCECNKIDKKLLLENLSKYNVLKRKKRNYPFKTILPSQEEYNFSDDVTDKIIYEIFNLDKDYTKIIENAYEANKLRYAMLSNLRKGFDLEMFYLPQNHAKRRETLFYDVVYGYESYLAGTGLREAQFKSAFLDPKFKDVIEFMCPEIIGLTPWNLDDSKEFQEFCNGIFDFEIPSYKETLPIRLASYFYPRHFIPIFKLEHLKEICLNLGFNSKSTNRGICLFEYNQFVFEQLKNLPYDNYIKSNILYLLYYTLELYKRIKAGEIASEIVIGHNEKWKKNLANDGLEILKRLNIIL